MKKYKISILVFLFSCLQGTAQNKLTLQQAIQIAIQNNYSIIIARTATLMASVSNSYGNAGFMPSVTFLASTSQSRYNTKQEFSTGNSVNRKNALTGNMNSSIALNWTVFDGMKMFATKDKLQELQVQGDMNLKIEIENTVTKIIVLYFDVVRQQQLINAANEAIKIYEERIKIADKKLEIGSGSRLDVLQAKVDLNAQKSALMKIQIASQTAVIALNQLLTKSVDETYTVEDSITLNTTLIFPDINNAVIKNNNQLQLAQSNVNVSGFQLKEIKSTAMPQVGVNLNYNLTQTKNQVGLVLLNQNKGLNAGLSASMNLFNGYKSKTQIMIAKFAVEQSELQLRETTSVIQASVLKSWRSYQSALSILKLEEENSLMAKENVTIALERFRVGSSNTLELMMAQKSFEDAISRLVLARYDAKVAETELLRLEGQLVK